MSLTRKDVLHLLYPDRGEAEADEVEERGGGMFCRSGRRGRVECEEESSSGDDADDGVAGDEDSIGDINVADLLDHPSSTSPTYPENTAPCSAATPKEILDPVLLNAMRQLGSQVTGISPHFPSIPRIAYFSHSILCYLLFVQVIVRAVCVE